MENKTHNGKEYKEALLEIKRLEDSQIVFKEDKREILKLKKKINSLEKERDILKNKNFKLGLRELFQKEVKREKIKQNGNGELKYLNRILTLLKEEKEPTVEGMIPTLCCATGKQVYPCLGFLVKTGLIKSIKQKGKTRYWVEK